MRSAVTTVETLVSFKLSHSIGFGCILLMEIKGLISLVKTLSRDKF